MFTADLHVHTCLSPCAELSMSPSAIADRARELNIDILGICDHNSAENIPAVIQAANRYRIQVLAGMEVCTAEEIHILALFDNVEDAMLLQTIIYNHLPGTNDENTFGMQVVVNEEGEVLRFNDRLLIGASTLSVEEVVRAIHDLNGLAIASHIDRASYSLISQLGFVPDNLNLDALEISAAMDPADAEAQFPLSYPIIQSSDAHFPGDIGRVTTRFYIKEGTTTEIKNAFIQKEGRTIIH
ncbi:MAG: PHP domain-containing protein [Candidatus Aminicenantes bacterium]|nr:PHP domain-containing protein [Candidatus Aminicenantes bacterium]